MTHKQHPRDTPQLPPQGENAGDTVTRLAEAGYRPVEPPPTTAHVPFLARCTRCETVLTVTLAGITGPVGQPVGHGCRELPEPVLPQPGHRRTERELERRQLERSRYTASEGAIRSRGRFRACCELCGKEVWVTLAALRREAVARSGRPRTECDHSTRSLVNPSPGPVSPARSTADEAQCRATLKEHDYEPVGQWPGRSTLPWHVLCLRCKAEVWVPLTGLRRRKKRERCSHPLSMTVKPAQNRVKAFLAQTAPAPPDSSVAPAPPATLDERGEPQDMDEAVARVTDEAVRIYRARQELYEALVPYEDLLLHTTSWLGGLRTALCLLKGWNAEQESAPEGAADRQVRERWEELHPGEQNG